MSVRVWQSHKGSDQWADWEVECSEHTDERVTTPTWIWAMESAWGHIAMHHPREAEPCTHEFGYHIAGKPEGHRCFDCGAALPHPDSL